MSRADKKNRRKRDPTAHLALIGPINRTGKGGGEADVEGPKKNSAARYILAHRDGVR